MHLEVHVKMWETKAVSTILQLALLCIRFLLVSHAFFLHRFLITFNSLKFAVSNNKTLRCGY